MSGRSNIEIFMATMAILIVAICPTILMIWLMVKTNMLFALLLWFVIFLVVGLSSWGSYYYKKIFGVQYVGRGGGLIGMIVSSIIMNVLLGLIYMFQLIF